MLIRKFYFFINFICLSVVGCSPLFKEPKLREVNRSRPPLGSTLNFNQLNVSAKLILVSDSAQVGRKTSFRLILWPKTGVYLNQGLLPHVWLWMVMASGSHGSSPVSVESSLDESFQPILGSYEVKNANFTMAGEWEIHIQLKDESGAVVDDEVVQYIWV